MSSLFISVVLVALIVIIFALRSWGSKEKQFYHPAAEEKIRSAVAEIKKFILRCNSRANHGKYTPAQTAAVKRLVSRFDESQIGESLAEGSETSYTVQKKKIYLCVRQKDHSRARYVDDNTIIFTVLHEISHVANDGWGHDNKFWSTFKFILLESVRARIYFPVNYSVHPAEFCGLTIRHNPLFDPAMTTLM